MAEYADLASIDDPTPGEPAPAAWGDQIRENFERLAKPYRAKVRRSVTQSIPHATPTPVSWGTGQSDLDLWVFTAPTVFTFPIGGWWELKFGGVFAPNGTGERLFYWTKGARVLGIESRSASAVLPSAATVVAEEEFLAGEQVSATVYQNSGGALNLDPTAYEIWATVRLVRRT